MSRESVLTACLVLLIAVWIPPPMAEANSPWESAYLFPVAASANGAGGTVWKTELCRTNLGIFNPSDDEIVVEVVECKNPSVCKFYDIAVPAQSTVQKPMRSNDFTEGYIAVLTPDYISAYTSTVNNKSGDAVFQGHRIVTLSASKDAGLYSSQLAPLLERIEANTKSNGRGHDFTWHLDRLRERLSAGELRDRPE